MIQNLSPIYAVPMRNSGATCRRSLVRATDADLCHRAVERCQRDSTKVMLVEIGMRAVALYEGSQRYGLYLKYKTTTKVIGMYDGAADPARMLADVEAFFT